MLLILGVLLGAVLPPMASQFERRQVVSTERALDQAKEALIGYAIVNGRLPCPDDPGDGIDGLENPPFSPGVPFPGCAVDEGALPWQVLGIEPVDEWGRVFHYKPSPQFTFPARPGSLFGPNNLDLGDDGTLTVFTRNALPGPPVVLDTRTLTSNAAAVLLSFGANGLGGRTLAGTVLPPPGASADEFDNSDGDASFATRPVREGFDGAGCDDSAPGADIPCEFDDIVTWLSPSVLFARLVDAGRLP